MSVKMKPASEIVIKLGFASGSPFQKWFANTCALHMDKYVPFDEGMLSSNISIATDGTYITYEQQYAGYQYYGIRKDGSHAINEDNRTRTKHPLATSYWDKHMVTAEMPDILKEAQDFLNRGGK